MSTGGSATAKAALLEEFAEACTVVARGLAPKDHDVQWENGKDGFVHFHCPLTGLNGAHTWTGAPRACAWVKGDQVEAWCTKCVGDKKTFPDQAAYETVRAAYTDAVKRAIRWEQDGVVHVGFKTTTVRSHLYFDRDFKHAIRRDKVRYEDGRKEKGNTNPWRWRVSALANGAPGAFAPMRAEPWLAANYPEHDVIYNALCWYAIDLFIDPAGTGAPTASTIPLKPTYRVVLTEGERDSDSFNMLMAGAGASEHVATCLCHPKPTKLASHHARLVAGRDVVIVGDADDPGKDQAENWASILWGQPSSIKIVRDQLGLSGAPDDKDLTDWIIKRLGPPEEWLTKVPTIKAVAAELLNLFASTAPLMEPPGRPTAWRSDMITFKDGRPKADSPHNVERVWTLHPGLKGKVRTNVRSGEVEVIDPPWGGGMVVGARIAALNCAMWLEKTEKLSLSTRALEEGLASNLVAPPYNPLQGLLDAAWDGVPRLDGLFTSYVPLDVEPKVAVALARVTMGDLVRKMRNELVGQKLMVGVATDLDLDVAGALLGLRGHQHRGKVNDRQVAQFARLEKMAVQVSMEPVANRQAALASLPCIFSPYTSVDGRLISSPLFLAVGVKPVDPRTEGKVDERCYLYDLAGRARLDAMSGDADQLVAEAVARLDELVATIVPSKSQTLTIDAREGIESVRHTLEGLHVYATQDPAATDIGSTRSIMRAPARVKPIQHVVRKQFLDVMRTWMLDAYRDVHAQELAFNAACRAMGWVKTGKPVALSLYKTKADELGWDIGGRDCATVPGILLTPDRLKELSDRLFDIDPAAPSGGPTPPPKGGGVEGAEQDDDSPIVYDSCTIVAKPSKTAVYDSVMEPLVPLELSQNEIAAPARTRTFDSKERKGPGYREGPGAVAEAGSILSTPGWCAIDFETWPTAASWHGDDAAERAPRGGKGRARADAVLAAQKGGRAKQRRACTLQLHHANGAEVFVRLEPGDDDAPRARQLQAMFDGRLADLVAHNAQFEVEVLLKHGVAADVDCTLLAAKALYLTAVGEDAPQPVAFGLADLVQRDLGRTRDKTIRDRDWRAVEALDDEAVAYGLQDARDCLALWGEYRKRLDEEGLFDGYRVMQRALLPTAATNLRGLTLDASAHAALMARMADDARRLDVELDRICVGQIDNHGSSPQVSTWIMEEVLQAPIKPPAEPKLVGLVDFLVGRGGLRPVGELRDMPKRLVNLLGLGLDDAANQAMQAGYIGRMRDYGQRETDVEDADPDELVRAVERDLSGDRVLTLEDDQKWRDYLAAKEHFDRLHREDDYRLSNFKIRLNAKTGGAVKEWRTTKTGHLAITKGGKLRKAEQLAEAFPAVSQYLVKHAQWNRATKLLDSFGPTLKRWRDDDGRCRGQFRVWAAWTGRQSCIDPNLQNQPREDEFRALWVAPPSRKLVIADYCLTGDTPVVTIDGIRPIADVVAQPSDVLSMAPGRELEFRRVERAALIGIVPVVRVTFADGSSVRCTLDHEWVDRSGHAVKTADLRPGNRLEHVHDSYAGPKAYPTWYVRSNRQYVYKHRLVAEHVFGPRPSDHQVDHVDGDVENWAVANLRYLPEVENRGQGAGRWWAKADAAARARKTADLVRGQRETRRSYDGAGNPNFGKLKGAPATCPTCGVEFYKPPSRGQVYCSMDCRRGNHRVVSIEPAGIEPIYHLTIEENHNFVLGNGLVSRNSQIELRLAAIESGDERLREVYREGRDVHSETASIITAKPLDQVTKADRQPAKGVNFLSVYGGGASKLAETIGCSLEHAHMILDRFFTAYPGLADYRKRMPEEASAQGFITIKPDRRVLYDPEMSSPTQAINAPIQGGAASVQMLALRLLHDALAARPDLDSFTAASVHDEFLVEAPGEHADEAAGILVDAMVRALLEIFPEAEDMGMARLTAAAVCDRWSEKP